MMHNQTLTLGLDLPEGMGDSTPQFREKLYPSFPDFFLNR